MENDLLIKNTVEFVKKSLKNAESGHDWFHTERVWKLSLKIAQTEQADLLVVQLAALLHDIADSKFYNGNENIAIERASDFLKNQNIESQVIEKVLSIIQHISFKGGNFSIPYQSKELDIVQDADRLDAIGAIGIARTFNYGGFKNRPIYNPQIKPNLAMNREEYKNSQAPTINHFYEKLLLLKDRMNTETAKKIAIERHQFMLTFLEQFYKEWDL